MWQMFISVWVGDVYTLVQHPVVLNLSITPKGKKHCQSCFDVSLLFMYIYLGSGCCQ